MTDIYDRNKRRAVMASVRQKDTAPELAVRRAAHALGYRFRLHRADLPGKPDVVFPKLAKVIFVHGCFWHRHVGCRRASSPQTRPEFWRAKFERNARRDAAAIEALEAKGWSCLVVWECETLKVDMLQARLRRFLVSG